MNYDEAGDQLLHTTRADFGSSLRKGSGRAALLLQEKPHDADLNAELLRACTKNLTYDRQCEESRVPYLCKLIRMTGQADSYRTVLESHLKAATSCEAFSDTEQVFGILCRLAVQDGTDQAVLRNFVFATEDKALAMTCVSEFVRLQGVEALLACVHHFGPEFAEDPWLIIGLKHAIEERDGVPAAAAALQQARRDDVALDRLLSLDETKTGDDEKPNATFEYAALKAEVERSTHKRLPYAWVKGASQAEIECAAKDLVDEPDEARVMAYLTIFRARPFPGDPTRLFPLLGSANRHVVHLATSALALVSHPAIRDFALQLIAEGRPELGTRLLRHSHRVGDLIVFRALLDQFASDDEAYHSIGLSALDVIGRVVEMPKEAHTILLHLYENDPCSICRGTAVKLLADADAVPDWMAKEGRYDAESSIAERFRPPAMEAP